MPQRLQALENWLTDVVGLNGFTLTPASSDASFRRYFRVAYDGCSYIAMDAPPSHEDCRPFVTLARMLRAIGVNAPAIHAEDLRQGFLLLDDLGSTHYLDVLGEDNAEILYQDAMEALLRIQTGGPRQGLPDYDRVLLLREMALFRDWLVERQLGLSLSQDEHAALDQIYERLIENALEQPQVCVHRDYHSRNLLVTAAANPGVLDFQDAVIGPITYDLVSLLKDCYIRWPQERVNSWAQHYRERLIEEGLLQEPHRRHFPRWFALMGIQRHLKAAGIFARLNLRDGKPRYLGDIPRTLGYIVAAADDYPELAGLRELIVTRVLPGLQDTLGEGFKGCE